MRTALFFGAALAAVTLSGAVAAAEIEVKMLDKGATGVMVFEPALVKIAPGDTVKFVPVSKGHNVEAIPGMVPDGVVPFTGQINETVTVKFDKAGVYGFKCKPHYGMGMVGMVVAGTPDNHEQAKAVKHPGKAKQVFAKLFADPVVASK
ncbi:pseudoazurin [uncultured Ferrovibrio sp.]|jgi:pseudoazurin|uniref:pseudoazurin n=1 Tax=uncultured Ferrovibrio sp. TaxID=1576913 RepID=UPI00260EE777|nr:pseudoazurin [uncultured Ferrovibrio sp.]